MCLIVLAWQRHPRWHLVLAANRDEFHDRPSKRATWWPELPGVVGGRDLRAGGSWLLAHTDGRFAAVTNVRGKTDESPRSRGLLGVEYLAAGEAAGTYGTYLAADDGCRGAYNLLLGDRESLFHLHGPSGRLRQLGAGVYGLSNADLDTPWPKVSRAKAALQSALAGPARSLPRRLFAALADSSPVPDAELPDTGVGPTLERLLAPVFLATMEPKSAPAGSRSGAYGTRVGSVLLLGAEGGRLLEYGDHASPPTRLVAIRFRAGAAA